MRLRNGDMFQAAVNERPDLLLVTSNAYVRNDGRLVMGRGAAWQASQRFPGCDRVFGAMVHAHKRLHPRPDERKYGVMVAPDPMDMWSVGPGRTRTNLNLKQRVGIFQVKWEWMDDADLKLVLWSVESLAALLKKPEWRGKTVFVNFPAIGNGRLAKGDVLPLLERLPDVVHVWELEGATGRGELRT